MDDLRKDQAFAFRIITASGDARSMAYGALEAAKVGNYREADELLERRRKLLHRRTVFRLTCWRRKPTGRISKPALFWYMPRIIL